MSNIEETDLPEAPKRRLRLDWILPVLFRPGKALREVVREEASTWLAPLLLLSLLVIAAGVVAGPLRTQAVLSQPPTLPQDFQYWSPDAQQKYIEANQPNTSPLFMYGFPILAGLGYVWIGWFLLGAILHIILTLSGSRGSRAADFSVAGWSMLPLAVRQVVRIAAMLITQQMVSRPGLSGFIAADATGVMAFTGALLALFDIYILWQIILLVIGASDGSGLARSKAIGAVLGAVLLLLALQALPGFVSSLLGGLKVDRPFFFF
jgi:hypothetical protein